MIDVSTGQIHIIEYLLNTFVNRGMFPTQEGLNEHVCTVYLLLQVQTFRFCFHVCHLMSNFSLFFMLTKRANMPIV